MTRRISFDAAFAAQEAQAFSDALLAAGALGASLEDADAGTPHEVARFAEPGAAAPEGAWLHNRVVALVDDRTNLATLIAQAASAAGIDVPAYLAEPLADEDWVGKVQAQFEPIHVGRTLWIVPSWHEPPASGAVVLRIDPGRAFGTGSHPSTRLALEWLERTLDEVSAPRVLDYGCGSGILAIAAAMLGAAHVDAVDVDSEALEVAAQNARRNAVELRIRSPDSLPEGDYDVVVANILAQPLIVLAPLLGARLRPGARLALAGILEAHADEVISAYAPRVALRIAARQEGWVLLAGEQAPGP